jgi:hypothetical protein
MFTWSKPYIIFTLHIANLGIKNGVVTKSALEVFDHEILKDIY